jgi:hypothetical protein
MCTTVVTEPILVKTFPNMSYVLCPPEFLMNLHWPQFVGVPGAQMNNKWVVSRYIAAVI